MTALTFLFVGQGMFVSGISWTLVMLYSMGGLFLGGYRMISSTAQSVSAEHMKKTTAEQLQSEEEDSMVCENSPEVQATRSVT